MKTKSKLLLIITLIFINLFFCTYSYAQTNLNNFKQDLTINSEVSDLNIYSESAVLMDSRTGKVLYTKNATQKMYPASTTKILTAIIAIEKCQLTDKITASKNAVMSIPSGYSNAAIQVGEALSVKDLLDVFLIHSANEAGFILAEHISGSIDNFANLMNEKALEIGCKNTHFTNPSGIQDENHYSTAYDMALIAQYCMKNETFRQIVSKTSCKIAPTDKYEERYFVTTNDLMRSSSKYYYEYAIGIKTGFTTQARNCLIAGSIKDGLELITVTLGALTTENGKSARYVDTINLFEYGFNNYKTQKIADKNTILKEVNIKNATKDTENLSILLKDDISALTDINLDLKSLQPDIIINENLTAPISEGSVVGKVIYNIDNINYSCDLIAGNNVVKSNLIEVICQIALAIVILIILTKLLSSKKSTRKKSYSKKKVDYDSIYKF